VKHGLVDGARRALLKANPAYWVAIHNLIEFNQIEQHIPTHSMPI